MATKRSKAVSIVFTSLLLDLLAFTFPLPLFPRLIEDFLKKEKGQRETLLARTLHFTGRARSTLIRLGGGSASLAAEGTSSKWDVTLLGGLLGSLFSFAQFVVSPHLGTLSDRFGRKPVLLMTMVGNIVSALLWLLSTSFSTYLISRVVGGLSEGNVQLAIAIISDVTSPEARGRSLALIGIAFSLCFTFGPPIGAYFASRPISSVGQRLWGQDLNIYATPAAITLGLLVVETLYLIAALPETRWTQLAAATPSMTASDAKTTSNKPSKTNGISTPLPQRSPQSRLARLRYLKRLHLSFLFVFSGAETTLTYLTFDLFDWSNAQNGKLLGIIGVISSLVQGGFVRRAGQKYGPAKLAKTGVAASAISLVLIASLPLLVATANAASTPRSNLLNPIPPKTEPPTSALVALWTAAILMAYTSATVVNSLNALASVECIDAPLPAGEDRKEASDKGAESIPALRKGRALGIHRSYGQLGRALGPLFTTGIYWVFGPASCYGVGAVAMAAVWATMPSHNQVYEDGRAKVE